MKTIYYILVDFKLPSAYYITVTSTVVRRSAPSKVFYATESRGGTGLDLGLKVPGYHGEFGKKRKQFAPGVEHCVPKENVKNADPGTYIKGNMGKVPEMTVFGNFSPGNLKTEKNDIAYHVGNFFSKFWPKLFFEKSDFGGIMTS